MIVIKNNLWVIIAHTDLFIISTIFSSVFNFKLFKVKTCIISKSYVVQVIYKNFFVTSFITFSNKFDSCSFLYY